MEENLLDLESRDSTQVTKGKDFYMESAEWTKDGKYIVSAKGGRNPKIFLNHRDGGKRC